MWYEAEPKQNKRNKKSGQVTTGRAEGAESGEGRYASRKSAGEVNRRFGKSEMAVDDIQMMIKTGHTKPIPGPALKVGLFYLMAI